MRAPTPERIRRRLAREVRRIKRRATRDLRRAARRLDRSGVGRRVPARWKRRAVTVAKQVGGDGVLQGGGRQPHRTRRLGIRVAVAGPAAQLFGQSSIERVELTTEVLTELTHLDVAVAPRIEGALAAAVDRLGAMRVHPRMTLPPLGPGFTPRGAERGPHETFLRLVGPSVHGAPAADTGSVGELTSEPARDRRLPPGGELVVTAAASLPDPLDHTDRWISIVQAHAGLLDHRASWSDHHARGVALVRAAAVGLPVVLDTSPGQEPLRKLLPAPVYEALAGADPCDLLDPLERYRVAHRQWQVVHRHFTPRARWHDLLTDQGRTGCRRPSVTVVVATRRPEMVDHWAAQIARQREVDVQVVAVLHGSSFTAADRVRAVSHLADRITVLNAPDRAPLGELLELATQAADGDLIVKWDDDDYYDVDHLADLVTTWEYTGADLVGKACDFVHLEGTDVTMRREQGPRETFSATIAGPTLCIARSALAELGGWRRAPKRVDSLLIDAVLSDGGRVYRAAGFGFVLRRAAQSDHGHTWDVPDQQFLAQSSATRRGLDLGFAGVRT